MPSGSHPGSGPRDKGRRSRSVEVPQPDFAHMDLEEGYEWPAPKDSRDEAEQAERSEESE